MRSTNTAHSVVPGCEATIKRNQAEGLAKAKFRFEQLEREVIAQREIVAKFSKNFDLGESVKRTNWVRDFHSSPFLKRVGQKKRPRSSSRGYRSTSRSSRGSRHGIGLVDHPARDLEVKVIILTSGEEDLPMQENKIIVKAWLVFFCVLCHPQFYKPGSDNF